MSLISESGTLSYAEPSLASAGDYFALLKPRVMSLVIFTALTGLAVAPGTIHPLTAFTALLCIAVGAGANALVSGNLSLRIPDWMSPLPGFIMDATSPGTERLACFATGRDLGTQLQTLLAAPAFRPIPDVADLAAVTAAVAAATGREGYTAASLEWQVVPRRPPANVPPPANAPANAPRS